VKRESPRASPPASPPPPEVDPAELQPDASLEIDVDLQKRMLELWAKLDTIDHFALLGVEQSADRKAVKNAFFTLVAVYHPDRYFKKRLGHFTKKIERIFQKMTEAHDTLSDEKGRKDYEAYFAAQRRTRALDTGLQDEAELLKQVEQLLQQAQEQARKEHQLAIRAPSVPPPVRVPTMPPPVLPGSPSPWQKPPAPAPKPAAAPVRLVDDPAARRRALARKLGRTAPGPAVTTVTVTAPAPSSAERQAAAAEDLKRRYEQRMLELQRKQIDHYVQVANEAMATGNPVSALNAMRIAAGLAPNNTDLMQYRAELEAQVAASLADGYIEQARYEENNGHHLEAARSYTRAAKGKPSADLLRSAAECYLKAGQELKQAADLARQAVQLAPERSELRLTLAKVYEAAGMKQSAVKELERTLEMSPNNAKIKEWLKRLERGGV
jgi:tetratricopeptide (TPR) repeat protein